MNASRSLRAGLISGLVGANLIVFALLGYSLYQSRQQHELRAQTWTQNIAGALDQSVSNSIQKIDLALQAVVGELEEQLSGQGIDEQAMNSFLAKYGQWLPEVEAFRIADAKGLVILGKGVNKQERVSWADREYFIYLRDHADAMLQISKPRIGRVAKQYIMGFARRYDDPDGRFAGVVSAPIALSHFTQLLSQYNLEPNDTLILRDADLGLITRVPPIPDQPAGHVENAGVSKEFRTLMESGVRTATYHITNSPDGFERILTFRRLAGAPMIAIVGTASNDYLSGWTQEVYKAGALIIGFLLFSWGSGAFMFRLLARSEQTQEQLRRSEGYLQTIIANEPECITVIDRQGHLMQINPAGLTMFEADSLAPLIGRAVIDMIAPEYRVAYAALHRRVIGGEHMQLEFELIGLRGGRRFLETRAVPMQDHDQVDHLAV